MSLFLSIDDFLQGNDSTRSFYQLRDYISFLSSAVKKIMGRHVPQRAEFNRRLRLLRQTVLELNEVYATALRASQAGYRRITSEFFLRNPDKFSSDRPIGVKNIEANLIEGGDTIISIRKPEFAAGEQVSLIRRSPNEAADVALIRAAANNNIYDWERAYQDYLSVPAARRRRVVSEADEVMNEAEPEDDFYDLLQDMFDDEAVPPQRDFITENTEYIDRVERLDIFEDWETTVFRHFRRIYPRLENPRERHNFVYRYFMIGSIFGFNARNAGQTVITSLQLTRWLNSNRISGPGVAYFVCGYFLGLAELIHRSNLVTLIRSRRPVRVSFLLEEADDNHNVIRTEVIVDPVDVRRFTNSLLRETTIYRILMDSITKVFDREVYGRVHDVVWNQLRIVRLGNIATPIRPYMLVDGNNSFWMLLFYDQDNNFRNQQFYKDCWQNMVLIPSEIVKDGIIRTIHGCFTRAILCKCVPSSDKPKICDCQQEDGEIITIADIARWCNENGPSFSYLIIAIIVSSRKSKEALNKKCDLIYISPNFYTSSNRKVIFINVPDWDHVRAHCALWLPPKTYKTYSKDPAFNEFCNISSYNSFLHKLTKRKESICPICGEIYLWSQNISHFNNHAHNFVCDSCGLYFDGELELKNHKEYHCKNLTMGSCITFPEEHLAEYQEKTNDCTIIYADLESAIDEEGKHTTILCGWTTSDGPVYIRSNIGRMLAVWATMPGDKFMIYFHNGENYDFHFIIEAISGLTNVKSFNITADSSEKIRYFDVTYNGKIYYFRDSFSYVSTSLEKWVKVTPKEAFKVFAKTFSSWKQELLLQKNPFPYNMIQCAEDLKKPFTDIIEACDADNRRFLFCYKYEDEEFEGIKEFLIKANSQCHWQTVEDYYVDYLKCDVAQLADCMEYFRSAVIDEYGIDIHCYYGAPSLSWAAWLKKNTFSIDLVTESDQFDIINSSIRGGQCGAMTRYYNQEEEPDTFVADLDANSLYATVMLEYPYPCNDWKWSYPDVDRLFTWLKMLHSKNRSGFIEIDLTVVDNPEFYSYVPIAQKRKLEGIYNYQAMYDICEINGNTIDNIRFVGLTQTMGKIEHYCAHTRLVEWYLSRNVIKVHKVYRVLHGHEEYVFKEYVKHNLDKRKEFADDPVKKMLYKLLNNSLYGKTYEDVTARCEYGLVPPNVWEKLDGSEVKRDIMEFNSKWHFYEKYKYTHQINRPIFLGAAITEYSKLWMYKFFYDKVRRAWPNSEVLYTDTDALTIKFSPIYDEPSSQTEPQVIEKISSMEDVAKLLNTPTEQIIDTSNFRVLPTDPLHTTFNGSPGLFKSETGDAHIVKMIALRAKTYIMVCSDGSIKMSIKGCPMNEKKKITYEDFKYILDNPGRTKVIEFDAIRSKYHIVKSVRLEKVALSGDDKKRFICPDLIHTLPFFSSKYYELCGEYETGLFIE